MYAYRLFVIFVRSFGLFLFTFTVILDRLFYNFFFSQLLSFFYFRFCGFYPQPHVLLCKMGNLKNIIYVADCWLFFLLPVLQVIYKIGKKMSVDEIIWDSSLWPICKMAPFTISINLILKDKTLKLAFLKSVTVSRKILKNFTYIKSVC